MEFFFGKKLTPKEQQRENDRALRKAGRDIERDRRELEREEKKLEMEIKKLAKEGNKEGCMVLAKQLVQMRRQKNRTFAANSKMMSIGVKNKAMGANMKLAEAMSTTTKTMRNINAVIKPEQVMADMSNFSKASMQMDMTDEMINDTLDDILDDEGDEEESDRVVNQVLDEIGIEIAGKINEAPSAIKGSVGQSSKSRIPTDEEIEAQLAKLRS
ncbi:charged multivesicular body protein 2b [Lycorma delicatula]|uniref:charged multivesicular body protein 2b n=1 Tax=Lycorma delicatula TaxID=130591 RepID=UPI003F5145B4